MLRVARAASIGTIAVPLAALACSDSLHLDPDPAIPGQGGSSSGPGTGGSGGEVPIACKSSADCPAPTSVCDVTGGVCVECLEIEDCAHEPGTVCSKGQCVCPNEGESFCPAVSGTYESRPARCVDLQTATADCGSCGHSCYGSCAGGKCVDAWEPTPLAGAPLPRTRHVCVSTGTQLFVFGGESASGPTNTGALFDPATYEWKPTSLANAPSPRSLSAAVWTGTKVLVWGGYDGSALGTGAIYDPATNTWKPMSTTGAPAPRHSHTAVWTGTHMIVWGGHDGTSDLDSGGQYDPAADSWSPTSTSAAPSRRRNHVAVWTGSRMIVHGGYGFDGTTENVFLPGGKKYDPSTDTWENLPTDSEPSARARHVGVWTGSELVAWGGYDGAAFLSSGATFADANGWSAMGGLPPSPRQWATGVWIGDPVGRVVVWGGDGPMGRRGDGGIFDPLPSTHAWSSAPMPTGPEARTHHCAVVVGSKMIVFGGETATGSSNTGGIFDPQKM